MSKAKYKNQYFVEDERIQSLWWCHGKWTNDGDEIKKFGAISSKQCKNMKIAIKHAKKILSLGGKPLISRRGRRKPGQPLKKKHCWKDWVLT